MSDSDRPIKSDKNRSQNLKIIVLLLTIFFIAIIFLVSFSTDKDEHVAFSSVDSVPCDLYLDGFDIRLTLCMYNPNSINAKLDRVDISVYFGNNNVAEVTIPKHITIPPNSEIEVDVDITIKKTGLLSAGLDYLFDKDNPVTVKGTVYYDSVLGTFEFPFEKSYDLGSSNPLPNLNTNQDFNSEYTQADFVLCNDATNYMLDVLESILSLNYSKVDLERELEEYDLDVIMDDIEILCNVDPQLGLVDSPYLNTETKKRLLNSFEDLDR